jgi:hypothetical protein
LTDLQEIEHALLKANDILHFVVGRIKGGDSELKMDYYKQLEAKIEANRDYFNVEVCIKSIIEKIVYQHEDETRKKIRNSLVMGIEYKEPVLQNLIINDWIKEEVCSQQKTILSSGRTLGGYQFQGMMQ